MINLTASISIQPTLLASIAQSAIMLMPTRGGRKFLETVVDAVEGDDLHALVARLPGCIWEIASSQPANALLQKCIKVMAPEAVSFMVAEFNGRAKIAAQQRRYCEMIECFLENLP